MAFRAQPLAACGRGGCPGARRLCKEAPKSPPPSWRDPSRYFNLRGTEPHLRWHVAKIHPTSCSSTARHAEHIGAVPYSKQHQGCSAALCREAAGLQRAARHTIAACDIGRSCVHSHVLECRTACIHGHHTSITQELCSLMLSGAHPHHRTRHDQHTNSR